jgi:hypothetical protein
MARLSRREIRRVRMWRRQDQEAVSRGQITEDVGVRWKPKGVGVKKRCAVREKRKRFGVDNKKVKVLRAPSRSTFREGNLPSPKAELIAPKPGLTAPEPESALGSIGPRRTPRLPEVQGRRPKPEPQTSQNLHASSPPSFPSFKSSDAKSPASKSPTSKPLAAEPSAAKLPTTKPSTAKPPTKRGIFVKPPSRAVVDTTRSKSLSKLSAPSESHSSNHSLPSSNPKQNPASSITKRRP